MFCPRVEAEVILAACVFCWAVYKATPLYGSVCDQPSRESSSCPVSEAGTEGQGGEVSRQSGGWDPVLSAFKAP